MPKNIRRMIRKKSTYADLISDHLVKFMGSWKFMFFQTMFYAIYITFNIASFIEHKFDPFPFFFLNFLLAFQTVVTMPIIMMSQNREESKDRIRDDADYEADLAAEKNTDEIRRDIKILKRQLEELNKNLLSHSKKRR